MLQSSNLQAPMHLEYKTPQKLLQILEPIPNKLEIKFLSP